MRRREIHGCGDRHTDWSTGFSRCLSPELREIDGPQHPAGRWIGGSRYLERQTPELTLLDLHTGERRELGSEKEGAVSGWDYDAWGRLVIVRGGKLQIWDPSTDSLRLVIGSGAIGLKISTDRRIAVTDVNNAPTVVDLKTGSVSSPKSTLPLKRPRAHATALGPRGIAAEAPWDGAIRVGYLDHGEPHLVLGHKGVIRDIALSGDGRWIAAATDEAVYLWPVPDLDQPPLHVMPRRELMAKLEALTNLRVVYDQTLPEVYRIDVDDSAYRGWKEILER